MKEIQIIDLGIDNAQYMQQHYQYTGIGNNLREAVEDALEQACCDQEVFITDECLDKECGTGEETTLLDHCKQYWEGEEEPEDESDYYIEDVYYYAAIKVVEDL